MSGRFVANFNHKYSIRHLAESNLKNIGFFYRSNLFAWLAKKYSASLKPKIRRYSTFVKKSRRLPYLPLFADYLKYFRGNIICQMAISSKKISCSINYLANAWRKPLVLFHNPRVKSGTVTGAELFSNEICVSGAKQDHSAKSYTSISNGNPLRKQ